MKCLYAASFTKNDAPLLRLGSTASLETALRLSRKFASIARKRQYKNLEAFSINSDHVMSESGLTLVPKTRSPILRGDSRQVGDMQDMQQHNFPAEPMPRSPQYSPGQLVSTF
jgi:hypothetical protein